MCARSAGCVSVGGVACVRGAGVRDRTKVGRTDGRNENDSTEMQGNRTRRFLSNHAQ